MADENIEGEGETPETPTGEETPETPTEKTEDKSKDLQSAIAQKEHFRAKAEKLQQELETLKGGKPVEEPELWEAPTDPLEVVKLGKVLKDFDENETEFIIRNAPEKNIEGIIKASKDPMVQIAIQAQREKVAKENKVPSPSSPAGTFQQVDAKKVVSEGSVAEAAAKEAAELEAKEGRSGGI